MDNIKTKKKFDLLEHLRRPHGIAVVALIIGLAGWAAWSFWIW